MSQVHIAIPEPTSTDLAYTDRNWPLYARAIESHGACAVRIPLMAPPDVQAGLLAACAGVLLPGSPADIDPQKYGAERIPACAAQDPAREATDELLLQDAFNLRKPILGICYGLQSLNVWKSGSLVQDIASGVDHRPGAQVQQAHKIVLSQEGLLAGIAALLGRRGECWINSSHHQAVAASGDGLMPVAWSVPDGVIEAVEGTTSAFVLGVQWHPEKTADSDPFSGAIFGAFVNAAAHWSLDSPCSSS